MSNPRRTFDLNTAISGLDADGTWDEAVHKSLVMPVRREIMKHDGMTGCFIGRYYIQVDYLDTVVDLDTVTRIVQDAVTWAVDQEGLFPFKSWKAPAIVLPEARKPANTADEPQMVFVDFSSHVLRFTPSSTDESWNHEVFRVATHPLATALTAHDGIVDFKLRFGSASLTYDPKYTTRDAVVEHMTRVFKQAAAQEIIEASSMTVFYFPYLSNDKPLELSFRDK